MLLLGVRRVRIEGNAIAGGIGKDRDPPLQYRGFRRQGFRAQRLRFRQRGINIVGEDVDQYLANLRASCLPYLDKRAPRTGLRLKQMRVASGIDLDLPSKHLELERAGRRGIEGRDFHVTNRMVRHTVPLSDGGALQRREPDTSR